MVDLETESCLADHNLEKIRHLCMMKPKTTVLGRATLNGLAGLLWPVGCLLHTPGLKTRLLQLAGWYVFPSTSPCMPLTWQS